jgi:molybdate transport system ATP-binding protein
MSDAPGGLQLQLGLQRPGFALEAALQLPAEGITVLFGPSGSGKTTVLRCVAGLERAQGVVRVGADTWQDDARGLFLPAWRRPVGYVFQEASLFPHLDVRGNLRYASRRAPRGPAVVALDDVIALLGIGHLLDRGTGHLSGGERQRVAIARALATQPRLLLLDEPLAALDAARKREVLPWLERLRERLRIPMLYVTHAPEELARLADHLVLLDQGRVQAAGTPRELLARLDLPLAQDEDAAALLQGHVAEVDGRWQLARVEVPGGALWLRDEGLAVGTPVRVRVLARDVSLSLAAPQPGALSIQNALAGTVQAIAPAGHPSQVLVRLDCGGSPLLARITGRAADALALAPGVPVWGLVKAAGLVR